jgi:hypothetical protein
MQNEVQRIVDDTWFLNLKPLHLKRSTQQYCVKCLNTSSEYGERYCDKCHHEYPKHWWSRNS